MGGGNDPAGHTQVFFDVGGDRGDDIHGLRGLLGFKLRWSSVHLRALTCVVLILAALLQLLANSATKSRTFVIIVAGGVV
jgi:hypothetical protein